MTRLMVTLETKERDALWSLAQRERRDARDQAALFIRQKLIECGLLPTDAPTPVTTSTTQALGASHDA